MQTDYHMHSIFSPDGHDTPEAMCQQAVALGLTGIAFTEHTEWHPHFAYRGFPQPAAYFERIRQCQIDFAPYGLIDFIAHFDRILWRGMLMGHVLDLQRLEPVLKETLTAVAQSGLGLELNSCHLGSSNHWHEALITMLTWYRQAGGHDILVNSDAHRAQHITANWNIAARLLALAGFDLAEAAALTLIS